MTFNLIESDIIAQLEPIRTNYGISVLGLPEKVAQVGSPTEQGWVALQWIRNTLDDFSMQEQNSTIQIEYQLDFQTLNLRGDNGSLYQVVNKTRELLWGYKPSLSYRPLTYLTSEFIGTVENYWSARASIVCYYYLQSLNLLIDYESLPPLVDTTYQISLSIPE